MRTICRNAVVLGLCAVPAVSAWGMQGMEDLDVTIRVIDRHSTSMEDFTNRIELPRELSDRGEAARDRDAGRTPDRSDPKGAEVREDRRDGLREQARNQGDRADGPRQQTRELIQEGREEARDRGRETREAFEDRRDGRDWREGRDGRDGQDDRR